MHSKRVKESDYSQGTIIFSDSSRHSYTRSTTHVMRTLLPVLAIHYKGQCIFY